MNVRLLKAKRVECGLRQIDLARSLHVTEKTMNKKECSRKNKFSASEMLSLTKQGFNLIFLAGTYHLYKTWFFVTK